MRQMFCIKKKIKVFNSCPQISSLVHTDEPNGGAALFPLTRRKAGPGCLRLWLGFIIGHVCSGPSTLPHAPYSTNDGRSLPPAPPPSFHDTLSPPTPMLRHSHPHHTPRGAALLLLAPTPVRSSPRTPPPHAAPVNPSETRHPTRRSD